MIEQKCRRAGISPFSPAPEMSKRNSPVVMEKLEELPPGPNCILLQEVGPAPFKNGKREREGLATEIEGKKFLRPRSKLQCQHQRGKRRKRRFEKGDLDPSDFAPGDPDSIFIFAASPSSSMQCHFLCVERKKKKNILRTPQLPGDLKPEAYFTPSSPSSSAFILGPSATLKITGEKRER